MYSKIKSIGCTALVLMFVALGCNTVFAAPELVLRFAGQNAADHPATKQMHEIAKEIGEKTDGRIEVKVYPGNQLGDYTLVYEEQIRGTIDMSCISVPSQFDPRMELIYINGYVSDYEDAKKVFAQDGWLFGKMNEYNERLGVKLLGFFIEGMIGTGTTKPAKDPLNPAAEQDVLIRVPNMDVYKLAAEAMGYRTVTVPYADVYQAIQTGVVNGVNGYPVAAAYTALGDVLKYWYMTNYSLEVLNYMISGKTWEKIKPEDQVIIKDVLARATTKSIENAKNVDNHYMDLMREKGIEVVTYTKEELAPLMKACATTWPKLEKNMTKELMDEFRKELAPK
ncbi:TRAP transporter substrate-binding protein DctP [Desulforhopalus singaporensis]|uniref:TRAP-type C4-dicarboxylate transport system, substrate-binding protein n=1 Tax=Desulforhopalus singaporensis TaxID=91360 RepID=A0A1H0RMQ4_9BACT|nr:TRAP transporter substrate-binding protein DctP [Desulforhopalus singaporensis]SDP30649.1 TRAP-type C4-dicarboxylate transport system, substrate-binding protein [Desulforhopalus singaporensis]